MNKISFKTLKTSLFTLFTVFILSCTEEGAEPTNGVDGIDGFNALVEVQNEEVGENCATGGVRISVGQDLNENGTLDESEITSVSFICNGAEGTNGTSGENGLDLVARTSPESPGEDCENGGTLVEIGADLNGNNSLDNNEVQTSFFVCNGTDGANGGADGENGLTSLIRVSPSESCENGGIEIEIGLDTNDNGELDPGEIDASYDICNGADGANGTNGANGFNTLSNVITEDPGPNCPNGGIKIELGLDTNENGSLDNDEVVSENYVCNGANGSNGSDGSNGSNGTDGSDGSDGTSSITRVSTEDPGPNCSNGGLIIEIGMDDVTPDGVLQNEEVDYTYYVCNGADGSDGANGGDGSDGSNGADGSNGFNSLIRTTTEDPGANCSNGGLRIDIGLDLDNSNTLEPGEYMGSPIYVCNGADGTNGSDGSDGADGRNLIVVTSTDVSCPNGGVEYTFGYDDNDDGTIDELLEMSLICNGNNGSDGADGSNGSDGTNGLNSIVRSTPENPGPNCGNGGTLFEVGIDDNRNTTLDPGEVDSFFYVCNGVDGSDGSNGNNSLITVSSFSGSQGGCTNGGLFIRTGIDDDGDSILDPDEIDATSYVCNGNNGSNGSDGNSDNIFEFYFQEGFDAYTGVLDASISDKNPTEVGESFSVDKGTTDSHGLIFFPELETVYDRVGEDFQIVEAILYLRGASGRVDGQTQGNWIGIKTLVPSAPLFEEDAVNWTRANSADENWSLLGVTSQNQDGDANGYSDMFQLPATGNFAFNGYIPLKLSIADITVWSDRDTGKENNKGMVLLMANPGIQYELDIFSSNYSKDSNYRPLLYLKVKTGIKGRSTINQLDKAFSNRWNKLTYKEKLAPLGRK